MVASPMALASRAQRDARRRPAPERLAGNPTINVSTHGVQGFAPQGLDTIKENRDGGWRLNGSLRLHPTRGSCPSLCPLGVLGNAAHHSCSYALGAEISWCRYLGTEMYGTQVSKPIAGIWPSKALRMENAKSHAISNREAFIRDCLGVGGPRLD